jgi:hypothetical protein
VHARKEVYEKLEHAIKEMNLPFVGIRGFIEEQMKSALEKYGEWKEQKGENEKCARAGQENFGQVTSNHLPILCR